ncbi:hypothetical protein Ciccas_002469 [Cichlidogyrus casuarinus]|uniref:Uncharacterized protein n=1 Tax=Cichlidogyrus casuarinus TaxID=1844966 RepID=A0ABD2QH70_9PLAT
MSSKVADTIELITDPIGIRISHGERESVFEFNQEISELTAEEIISLMKLEAHEQAKNIETISKAQLLRFVNMAKKLHSGLSVNEIFDKNNHAESSEESNSFEQSELDRKREELSEAFKSNDQKSSDNDDFFDYDRIVDFVELPNKD